MGNQATRLLCTVALGMVLFACDTASDELGPDSVGADVTDTWSGHDETLTEGLVRPPDSESVPTDLTGTWAVMQVVGTTAQVPLIGEMKTVARAILRWEMTQEGSDVTVHQVACELELESDSDMASTIVPQAFVDAIEPVTRLGTVDLSVTPATLQLPLFVELHGVALEDPHGEELPTTPDDPRVVDQDHDGKPGMTVFVTGVIDGAMYVIQRNKSVLDGTIGNAGIQGLMQWEQEQIVLGSDNPILQENPPHSGVDPDPSKTYFKLVRVDSDLACEEILERREMLFGE